MLSRRSFLAATAATALSTRNAIGQSELWQNRPIKIIVPTAAGGSYDITARIFGEKLSPRIDRPVVVENISPPPVAHKMVSTAEPDGHTLIMTGGGYTTGAALNPKLPYDPHNGLLFISSLCTHPMVYSVRPDSPIKSFKDMLDAARATPDKLTYPIVGNGSVHQLLGAWVDIVAGTKMVPIPYRGSAQSLTDMLAGRIDVMLEPSTSGFPRIRNHQVRPLALSSPARYPLMPDVPTIAETLPGIEAMSWIGLAAPPMTPQPIVDRILAEIRHALTLPDVIARFHEMGDVPTPESNPAQMKELIEREIANWNSIIDKAGIQRQQSGG
jgi:tripartite-type tricarboxylate transporter receptor subunit TctC